MEHSNKFLRNYILQQLVLTARGFLSSELAYEGVKGYYKALEDLDGVDDLTEFYYTTARDAFLGSNSQKAQALQILTEGH